MNTFTFIQMDNFLPYYFFFSGYKYAERQMRSEQRKKKLSDGRIELWEEIETHLIQILFNII